jgi:hypothetical protein
MATEADARAQTMKYEDASFAGGIGEGVGDVLGTIIAEIVNAGSREEQEKLRAQAMAEYNIDLPPVAEMKAEAIQSQAATAQGDAAAKATRRKALELLAGRADEGYNAEDRAAINDTLNDVAMADRGRRESFMRTLSPNSGAAVAARLASGQQAAQQANSQALTLAGQSRRNALNAIAQSGDLAGDIDQSEFGQNFSRGQAGDAISQFNERNRVDVGQWNAAQQQLNFKNKMDLADAKSGASRTRAEELEREAARRQGLIRGGFRIAGKAGGAATGAL